MKQFDDAGAALLGLSVDTVPALRTWAQAMGGIRHPLLSDFWPHGEVHRQLDVFNDGAGVGQRSLIIVDPQGVVRHTELHQGTLPNPADALARLEALKQGA